MSYATGAAKPPAARADTGRPAASFWRPQQRSVTSKTRGEAAERQERRLKAVETAAAEAATAAEATTAAPPPADTWAAFAAAVSGEWEGVTASFGPDGSPIQLPEYYVPQVRRLHRDALGFACCEFWTDTACITPRSCVLLCIHHAMLLVAGLPRLGRRAV